MTEVVIDYTPRHHFLPFHERETRFAVMVVHRRGGKTVACVNEIVARAIYSTRKRPAYAYIGPQLKQAKKVAWEYLKEYTKGLTDKISESELYVRLKHNQAVITVCGADNPDSFRGQYFDGVVLDEYGDMHPEVWSKVLLPALSDRKGWAVFIGTPKGKNHLYKVFTRAANNPNWFRFILPASESGILDDEELTLQRSEMDDDEYAQEYECSFDAAVKGTYYSKALGLLEASGHVTAGAEYDPEFPVHVATDLGYTDSSSFWFWQEIAGAIRLIDYEEGHSKDLDGEGGYFEMLKNKGYRYGTMHLPHDARAKHLGMKFTIVEQFIEFAKVFKKSLQFDQSLSYMDLVNIVPKHNINDGIAAVRKSLPNCWWHPRCDIGIETLRAYARKWNEILKCYSDHPDHNWASHGSDAFRYLCSVALGGILASTDSDEEDKPPKDEEEVYTLDDAFEEHERILASRSGRI